MESLPVSIAVPVARGLTTPLALNRLLVTNSEDLGTMNASVAKVRPTIAPSAFAASSRASPTSEWSCKWVEIRERR
jgi:hypothetical protein